MVNKTAKNKTTRKAPSASATEFSVGKRKKGNDGKMWVVVKTKNGVHRWNKVGTAKTAKTAKKRKSKQTKDEPEDVWGKNKKLEEFWRRLASGKEVVLQHKDGTIERYKMPTTLSASRKEFDKLKKDDDVKAIITSAQASDVYEALYDKTKGKTIQEIINNYKKYSRNIGDKVWYL